MIPRTGESPSPALRYLCVKRRRTLRDPSGQTLPRCIAILPGGGGSLPSSLTPNPLTPEGRCELMIKWNYRATRVALVLGAIAAFAIASGAQTKWQ